MELVLFRRFKAGALLAAIILLVACSPKLDWRIVQSPQERYTALFPGKPDKLERRIPYEEQELQQTLEAVKIDDDIYSISSIQVPVIQVAATEKIIAQLKNNLVERAKSSGGTVLEESAIYQASNRQKLPTTDYFITFIANGKEQQQMRVRWITRQVMNGNSYIYQVSVLHSKVSTEDAKALLSQEAYANFFNEFYPE
jgi:restriction endonuclease S subunit